VNILGIKIDNISKVQAQEKVKEFLIFDSKKQFKIFTPNPEFLVKADKDNYFKKVLNQGDLNLPDGRGLQLFSKGKLKAIAGSDFILDICEIASKLNKSIYLLGSGNEDTVKKAAKKLLEKIPNLKIVGFNPGPVLVESKIKNYELQINELENNKIIEEIKKCNPAILFVGMGMGKQEKWIYENLNKIPSIKIAMGIGGTFDFLSEKITRAPKLIRIIWLEWLWRLILQPKRIKRIINATIVFPYLILKKK